MFRNERYLSFLYLLQRYNINYKSFYLGRSLLAKVNFVFLDLMSQSRTQFHLISYETSESISPRGKLRKQSSNAELDNEALLNSQIRRFTYADLETTKGDEALGKFFTCTWHSLAFPCFCN